MLESVAGSQRRQFAALDEAPDRLVVDAQEGGALGDGEVVLGHRRVPVRARRYSPGG
jgi:hypothetical protein